MSKNKNLKYEDLPMNKKNKKEKIEKEITKNVMRVKKKKDIAIFFKIFKFTIYVISIMLIESNYNNSNVFSSTLLLTLFIVGINFFEKNLEDNYESTIITIIGFCFPMMSIFLLTMLNFLDIMDISSITFNNKFLWPYFSTILVSTLYLFDFVEFGYKKYKGGF